MRLVCDKCTGCGMCINVCGRSAIQLKLNSLGEEVAAIDALRCVNCGLCEQKCPQLNDVDVYKPIHCYAAWTKNEIDYKTTSSGGIGTLLSRAIVEGGGVVYGAAFLSNCEVCHIRVTEEKELELIKGSKYVQSHMRDCLDKIAYDLSSGRKVLFIGTPCQVAAVKQYCSDIKTLITVDLICHGTPPQRYFSEYLDSLVPLKKKNMRVSFRTKNSYRLSIFQDCRMLYSERYDLDPYFKSFMDGLIFRENCYSCKYANLNRCGDITLGDFWGIKKLKVELDMPESVSCVLLNTKKGIELFDKVKNRCYHEAHTPQEAARGNSNLRQASLRHKDRDKFNCVYIEKGFLAAVSSTAIIKQIKNIRIKDIILVPYRYIRYGKNYKELM